MGFDYKWLKQIVEQTILTEGECMKLLCQLLAKENETLHNSRIAKIISILGAWEKTPPVETLKQLKELADQKS